MVFSMSFQNYTKVFSEKMGYCGRALGIRLREHSGVSVHPSAPQEEAQGTEYFIQVSFVAKIGV